MSWLPNKRWQVYLSANQAHASLAEEQMTVQAGSAQAAWEALCARLPQQACVNLILDSSLNRSFLLHGAETMSTADWQMLARAQAKAAGLETERYTLVFDQAWLTGPRLAVAVETALLHGLTVPLDTDKATVSTVRLASISAHAVNQIGLSWAGTPDDAMFAFQDESSWVLAGFQAHQCQFWLSYPGTLSREDIKAEATRAALAHGFELSALHFIAPDAFKNLALQPRRTTRLRIEFITPARRIQKTLLGFSVLLACMLTGYWFYLQDAMTQTRKDIAQIRHTLAEQAHLQVAAPATKPQFIPEALKTDWPSIFKQLESLSDSPDIRVSSFNANGAHRSVTLELRHTIAEDKLPVFLGRVTDQGWKIVSIRPHRNAGSDEPTEVVLEAE